MNKIIIAISAWTLGAAAFVLPAQAQDAMAGMNMGGTKAVSKPGAAPSLSLTATLSPTAPRMGDNTLDISIADAGGKPVTGLKLSASVAMTGMDMGTTRPAITETGGGHYRATVNFSMNGPWRVVVRGQRGKIAALTFEAGAKTPWKSPQIKVPGVSSTPDAAAPAAPIVPTPSIVPSTNAPTSEAVPPAGQAVSSSAPRVDMATGMAGMDMKGAATPGAKMEGMTGIADMKTATVPELQEKGTYTATGDEDWSKQAGFGHNSGMVGMMNQMMVGGSGMEGMKMPAMTMKFGKENYAKPDGDNSSDSMAGMDMSAKPADATKASSSKPDAMAGMKMDTPPPAPNQSAPNQSVPVDNSKSMASMNMAAPAAGSSAPASASPVKITAVTVSAPKAGDNALSITLIDAQGKPVAGAAVKTTVAMTSMDMGTAHPAVTEKGAGQYASTVTFSMAGPWRVTVKVTPPGQKPQSKAFDFTAK